MLHRVKGGMRMQFIGYTKPKMLIAEEGKMLRAINDIYEEAHNDEEGNFIEEHFPYYSDFVFLANGIDTLEKCKELYVEEVVEDAT